MADASLDEAVPLMFHASQIPTRSDNRTTLQKRLAVCLILVSAAFERLAFYALAGNLTFFLTSNHIQWTFPNPIIASMTFLGTSYISSLFFSWVSDGKLGRRKTIIFGFLVYIVGYTCIILIANPSLHERVCQISLNATTIVDKRFFQQPCVQYILPMLIITAVGVGAVQANMAVFGAEQIREQQKTTRYFDGYYAAVNTGGLIAFGAIAYLQLKHYFIGYLVPGGLLVVALLLFLAGYRSYFHVKPHDSVITNFFPVLFNALQGRWKHRENPSLAEINRRSSDEPGRVRSESLSFSTNEPTWSFLDYAKVANNGRFIDREVDDIKLLRRVIVVFLLLIPYWLVYVQVETTFVVQGAHMRLPARFKDMPVIWLSLANQVIIIVTIIILNTFVYKRLQANDRSFSIKARIIIGMLSGAVAMAMAGTVELVRQNVVTKHNFTQIIGDANYTAADLSIFYQFPQYVGIGLSEVFTSVASLEFAYLAAPQSAQSLIMSLRFCSAGLSSFFGSAIVVLFTSKNRTDKSQTIDSYRNDPLYYIYFFVLAGVQVVFATLFWLCDRRFKILKVPRDRFKPRLFISPKSGTSSA